LLADWLDPVLAASHQLLGCCNTLQLSL
jgi:hypothetical protein